MARLQLTPLLLGVVMMTPACGEDDPPLEDENASPPSGGDGDGDTTFHFGGAPSADFAVEGGFYVCGNPLDCPDPNQECRKAPGERVGVCVECESAADCAEGEFCTEGQCGASLCVVGQKTCVDDTILATCNAEGTGFVDPEVCDGVCVIDATAAACVAGSGSGGSTAGGTGGTTASGGSSAGTGGSSTLGPNLVTNGDFANGSAGWEGGTGTPPVDDGKACVSWNATIGWQGTGAGMSLEPGNYSFTFDMSGSGFDVEAKIGGVYYPYEPVLLSETFSASNQTKTFNFSVASAEDSIGIAFNVDPMGSEFCIDNVTLNKN